MTVSQKNETIPGERETNLHLWKILSSYRLGTRGGQVNWNPDTSDRFPGCQ